MDWTTSIGFLIALFAAIFFFGHREAEKAKQKEIERRQKAKDDMRRCPKCKGIDTDLLRTEKEYRRGTENKFQTHTHYDSDGNITGTSETIYEVPCDVSYTRAFWSCNQCNHKWDT